MMFDYRSGALSSRERLIHTLLEVVYAASLLVLFLPALFLYAWPITGSLLIVHFAGSQEYIVLIGLLVFFIFRAKLCSPVFNFVMSGADHIKGFLDRRDPALRKEDAPAPAPAPTRMPSVTQISEQTHDLQSTLDKWLALAQEEAKRQAVGQLGTLPPVPPVPPAEPEPRRASKRKSKLGVILLSVFLVLSIAGNIYLYFDRQSLIKRYGKLLNDYDTMEQRAQTYRAFYDSAKDIMSDRNFEKAKSAAEKRIKEETLWTFNPKWGY